MSCGVHGGEERERPELTWEVYGMSCLHSSIKRVEVVFSYRLFYRSISQQDQITRGEKTPTCRYRGLYGAVKE